jgi:hypothetical protein
MPRGAALLIVKIAHAKEDLEALASILELKVSSVLPHFQASVH